MVKLALLFPGQGSQYVGMGKRDYEAFAISRQTFEEANDTLGLNLRELCFNGTFTELTRTENAQPAILTMSMAAFRVLRQELGVTPSCVAGHSLGEITALTAAGAIQFRDALTIVRRRGQLMQEAAGLYPGTMLAVQGIERCVIESTCQKFCSGDQLVVIANYNAPNQIVISGHHGAVAQVAEALNNYGAELTPLKVSAAFHSPLMQSAAGKIASELQKYRYQEPSWPVIANLTGQIYPGKNAITEYLRLQIIQPVRWIETMEFLAASQITTVIEVGPQTVLRNLTIRNIPSLQAYSVDDRKDRETIQKLFKVPDGLATEYEHTVVTKCIQIAICTRNRNWDNDEYQRGVTEPYRQILQLQTQIEQERRTPNRQEMEQALKMLVSVFKTKRVPVEEQRERFEELFSMVGVGAEFADLIKDIGIGSTLSTA